MYDDGFRGISPNDEWYMDKAARRFILENRDLGIDDIIASIAVIPGQSLTYLTVSEEDRIK